MITPLNKRLKTAIVIRHCEERSDEAIQAGMIPKLIEKQETMDFSLWSFI